VQVVFRPMENLIVSTAAKVVSDLLLSSSSEESSSDDDDAYDSDVTENVALLLFYREEHGKQAEYMDVIKDYSDLDHWRHFRMTRSTTQILVNFVQPFLDKVYHGGCPPICCEEMIYITIVYLANQGAVRLIGDKFGRSESACWNCIRVVTKILSENQNQYIEWPSAEQIPAVAAAFQARAGFPGVISAVDGCHIKIHPPLMSQKSYLNYKRFHSIILLGFVRSDRQFSYVSVGFPGSNHDSYVLQRSNWWEKAQTNLSGLFPSGEFHVIGDSAFPLRDFLMVPYKQSGQAISPEIKTFNRKLSCTRVVVEQAFGDLQNRFRRCLDIHGHIVNAVDTVVAACVIHNMCIRNGDMNFAENCVDPVMSQRMHQTVTDNETSANGVLKRNMIARFLK